MNALLVSCALGECVIATALIERPEAAIHCSARVILYASVNQKSSSVRIGDNSTGNPRVDP
jgi:hypothetical protein